MLITRLGRKRACYNGALRIYWPGFGVDDEPALHPFWTAQQARQLGERLYLQIQSNCLQRGARSFSRRSSLEIVREVQEKQHDRLREQVRWQQEEKEDFHRQVLNKEEEITLLRTQVQEGQVQQNKLDEAEAEFRTLRGRDEENHDYRQLLDIAEQDIARLKEDKGDLQRQLEDRDATIERLQSAIPSPDDYQDALGAISRDELLHRIKNVKDAVDVAEERLDNLHFLQSAHKSADRHPYEKPLDVYKAFELLNEIGAELKAGPLGKSIADRLAPMGIDYSPNESEVTMNKFRNERRFKYGGKLVEMPAHLKFGASHSERYTLRVHLQWSDEDQEWLIGHVGRHLSTASG